jgi:hypothetical protein
MFEKEREVSKNAKEKVDSPCIRKDRAKKSILNKMTVQVLKK